MKTVANTNQTIRDQILAAETAANEATAQRERSLSLADRLRGEIAKLESEAKQAEAEAAESARKAEQARREAKDRARELRPDRVDANAANEAALMLLFAFRRADGELEAASQAELEGRSVQARASALWETIDDVRCRLMTEEVDQNASRLVLAVEATIAACDDFEAMRRSELAGVKFEDGSTIDGIRAMSFPQGSRVVRQCIEDLHAVMENETREPKLEGIGTLLSQNVAPSQICKIYGIVLPNGSADFSLLGAIIDRSLGRCGFYRDSAPWQFLRGMGALGLDDAWKIRQAGLEERRNRPAHLPGSPQRTGALREGRLPTLAPVESREPFDSALAMKNHIWAKSKAEAKAKEIVNVPDDADPDTWAL